MRSHRLEDRESTPMYTDSISSTYDDEFTRYNMARANEQRAELIQTHEEMHRLAMKRADEALRLARLKWDSKDR